jgi:hypothetical protein
MKYALINQKGRVVTLSDTDFLETLDNQQSVEITDEQADQIEQSDTPLFLIGGNLYSRKGMLWQTNPESVKEKLRPERNRLLSDSDWTQLDDSPLNESDKSAWAEYRQLLRDITGNIDENGEAEFPTAP